MEPSRTSKQLTFRQTVLPSSKGVGGFTQVWACQIKQRRNQVAVNQLPLGSIVDAEKAWNVIYQNGAKGGLLVTVGGPYQATGGMGLLAGGQFKSESSLFGEWRQPLSISGWIGVRKLMSSTNGNQQSHFKGGRRRSSNELFLSFLLIMGYLKIFNFSYFKGIFEFCRFLCSFCYNKWYVEN